MGRIQFDGQIDEVAILLLAATLGMVIMAASRFDASGLARLAKVCRNR